MNGYGGPYTTKSAIIAFISTIQSDVTIAESDISDVMLASTTEQINYRTDTVWEVYSGTLYVDGRGEDFVFSPITPIVTLTGVAIIAQDTTVESLILTGTSREVWWNEETGCIKRINWDESHIEVDPQEGLYFPEGLKNIRLIGTFGRATHANILAMLQTLLVLKLLTFKYPSTLVLDLIMEKIGEYQYRVGDQATSRDPKNIKKTLDGYIEYLFDCLPKDDKLTVLAV